MKERCTYVINDHRAIQMGPVPAKFEDMYNEMSYGDIIEREYYEIENGIYGSLFKPKVAFNETLFDDFEIEIMEMVSKELKSLNTKEVINKSHNEKVWQGNSVDKKIISYKDSGFKLSEI